MKKTLTIALSMVLVAALAITGTMAYLSAKTESVTNKFTFGNIGITLEEPTWDKAATNGTLKVSPGATVAKDPTVTVTGTEAAYVYVLVDNQLAEYVTIKNGATAEEAVAGVNDEWVVVETYTGKGTVYRYETAVTPAEDGTTLETVFDFVTIDGDKVTMELLDGANNPFNTNSITIKAFAYQADGVAETAADAAAVAEFSK